MTTQTIATGHVTAQASLHDLPTTPFLAFHNHLTKPAILSIVHPALGDEVPVEEILSTMSPSTDLSLALAAAAQSDVESSLGMVDTLRAEVGGFGRPPALVGG